MRGSHLHTVYSHALTGPRGGEVKTLNSLGHEDYTYSKSRQPNFDSNLRLKCHFECVHVSSTFWRLSNTNLVKRFEMITLLDDFVDECSPFSTVHRCEFEGVVYLFISVWIRMHCACMQWYTYSKYHGGVVPYVVNSLLTLQRHSYTESF